jgi:CubicO group peptidase (beta-lactamase class C family)
VSKQFTAAAVLMLVEQGKLALSDDITRYLPELTQLGSVVTINDLLTHTSGLRDWTVRDNQDVAPHAAVLHFS